MTVLDSSEKHLEVVVDDSQLSLAIGKKGQNVRLAAKLLGWKIDIKSEEEKRQEVEQQMSQLVAPSATPLEEVPGLGEGLIEKLKTAGVTTVEALADMTPEQLEAIEGIGPKTVEKISLAVSDYFSNLEAASTAPAEAPTEPETALADARTEGEPEVATEETTEAAGEGPTAEALESAHQAEPSADEPASTEAEAKPESFTAVEKKP